MRILLFICALSLFHVPSALGLQKQGIRFDAQLENLLLALTPSIDPDGIWIKVSAHFLLDGFQCVYAEVSIVVEDSPMGSWTAPILVRAPIIDLDWANAEIFALTRRIDDLRELRNPRKSQIEKLIESGRRIYPRE